jgi:quercetin dioxygenase-like cupin family protein
VDLQPGTTFPKHTHPGEEVIYVLEGTWQYEIDGKTVTAKAGEILFIPAGAVHSAKNVGKGNAAELATYIVEKGKPVLTIVE